MNTMCQHIRVLIVDDHPLVRHGLAQLLQGDESIEVVGEAINGRDALKIAAETEPDAVVLDYQMPGMNGAETTAALLGQQPGLTVIGMSNDDRPHVRRNMLAAGADDFLMKDAVPFEIMESLHAAVAE